LANLKIQLLNPVSGRVSLARKNRHKMQLKFQKSDEWPADSEVTGMVETVCADDLPLWDGEESLLQVLNEMVRSEAIAMANSPTQRHVHRYLALS
jgi:hypothetical protein